jgi:hypothetical protein
VTDPVARERALIASRRLFGVTIVSLLVLLLIASAIGWSVLGASGARSAALGVALTGVLFAGGLLGLDRASRSGGDGLTQILVAFSLRMVVYASAFALVTRSAWVHGPSLALATAASLAVMLSVELSVLVREPLPELDVGPAAGQGSEHGRDGTGGTSTTTRS